MKFNIDEIDGSNLYLAVALVSSESVEYKKLNYEVSPSKKWQMVDHLIGKYNIEIVLAQPNGYHTNAKWMAVIDNQYFGFANSHLVAVMRCYLRMKCGDEVEIPE